MYYLVFAFFYLHSLLPFRVLYFMSDVAWVMLYYVIGYRKKVVLDNLSHAFPEKSPAERRAIARAFYRNFCDTWMETMKMMSMTRRQVEKRMRCDLSLIEQYAEGGKSIQLMTGHYMNWEYTLFCVPIMQPIPLLAVYMPLSNKIMDRLMYHLRSRFGAVLIGAGKMTADMKPWVNRQYLIGLAADQSPLHGRQGYWLNFMHRPAPFVRGPWDRGSRMNQPSAFMEITKVKRGYYFFRLVPLEVHSGNFTARQLLVRYVRKMEDLIRQSPETYLWSHKRWKHTWKPDYAPNWVDTEPMPGT